MTQSTDTSPPEPHVHDPRLLDPPPLVAILAMVELNRIQAACPRGYLTHAYDSLLTRYGIIVGILQDDALQGRRCDMELTDELLTLATMLHITPAARELRAKALDLKEQALALERQKAS